MTAPGKPPGALAHAEPVFTSGPLAGAGLVGFGIWERSTGRSSNVTFASRRYTGDGARRSFALLRPVDQATTCDRLLGMVLQPYADYRKQAAPEW